MGGFFKRFKDEMSYLKNKNWTLSEIGKFWDNLEEYDDINSKIYPYQMRFLNSKKLIDEINLNGFNPNNCLDLQTRTGNGSIFWSKKFPDVEYSIADFSKNFLEKRLTAPLQVSNVWTTLDGTSLSDSETIHYDRVFQGF